MDRRTLKQKIWEIGKPGDYTRDEYITRVYNVLLRRDPDQEGLQRYRQSLDLSEMLVEVLHSVEFQSCSLTNLYFAGRRDKQKRILLFGAYGNGNLGDAIQAASLGGLIHDINPNVEVWSSSDMLGTYPFAYNHVLPHGLIRDPYFVNQFDLLLIGGGGLFSHPHPPLNDIEWQESITPPVVIIGVGADESVIAQSEVIIRKALFVSGRDESSVKALSTLRGDIRFCPDPVIADPSLRANRNENPRPITSQAKTLWILKASPETQFASLRERIDADRDSVCFLEPSQEYSLLMDYPAAQAIYSSSELVQLIDEAQNVVSMRYHGCILSMMRGRPVMGVREDKSRQLLSRYGNTIYFTPVFDNFELPDFSNFIPTHQALDRDRSIVLQELTYALNAALLLK